MSAHVTRVNWAQFCDRILPLHDTIGTRQNGLTPNELKIDRRRRQAERATATTAVHATFDGPRPRARQTAFLSYLARRVDRMHTASHPRHDEN